MPRGVEVQVAEPASGVDVAAVELGGRLRTFRQMRKLTQRQVADHAEVSVSFLSQLERGVTGASVTTLRLIAEALGLSVADLFTDGPLPGHRVLRAADRPMIR